jgi:hypothetical protein
VSKPGFAVDRARPALLESTLTLAALAALLTAAALLIVLTQALDNAIFGNPPRPTPTTPPATPPTATG